MLLSFARAERIQTGDPLPSSQSTTYSRRTERRRDHPAIRGRRVVICPPLDCDPWITCVCVFVFVFGPQQQPPLSSSPAAAAVPCHRRRRADEEGEDRHRYRTSAIVVPPPPNVGGRSSAANPEQSARSRTHRTDDTRALYAAAAAKAKDEVRRLTRGRLPLPTTTDAEAAALDYCRRRYGMYATAAVTADDRYGHRYGLSSGLTTPQDPKTSSAAAAFFLRLVINDYNITISIIPL